MELIVALVALAAMEIVLGIDNIVFIAILTSRLPVDQQPQARRLGLMLALVMRVALLLTLSVILQLDEPLFELSRLGFPTERLLAKAEAELQRLEALPHDAHSAKEQIFQQHAHIEMLEQVAGVSGKDLILFFGGLFLIWKSVHEIHKKIEGEEEAEAVGQKRVSFGSVLFTIAIMDIVFSLDSVITAVGMVKAEGENFWMGIGVMVAAVVLAIVVMLVFAEPISRFVEKHPSVKMLALSFLILIGVMLLAEGIGTHFNKGYIYFAMAFALLVEMLNLRVTHHSQKRAAS